MRTRPDVRAFAAAFALSALLAVSGAAPAQAQDAQAAYDEGRFDDAIGLSLASIEKDPRPAEPYLVLCWSYLKKGSWESARTYAAKALTGHRYDHRVIEILGRATYNLGRNDESIRYFQEYVSLLPEGTQTGPIYFLLGELFLRQGRYSHADISFTTAVNFMPGDAYAWFRLGYAREKAADYRNALDAYLRSLKLNPALKDAALGKERVESLVRG
jgi:tetratricopeptide (TPR) repeat protein